MARILVLAGLADSLLNFRGPLLRAMRELGHEVHAAAPGASPEIARHLAGWGIPYHPVPLARAGLNPLADIRAYRALVHMYAAVRPEIALSYTIKPVIYGSLAAARAGVPRIFSLITGLGWTFTSANAAARATGLLVRPLYRRALARNALVFFQNHDDQRLFEELGLISPAIPSLVVPGSGVELDHFSAQPLQGGPPTFLLIARLLRDKGIVEYAEAARLLRTLHPGARFRLVGPLDPNPASLSRAEVETWVKEGLIEWPGAIADVRPELAACQVYVLPSWREGTPRTVLEAMSIGRAIITTDAPGCRETIRDGQEGFLVPVREPAALAAAMERFLVEPKLAARMGSLARARAESLYDVRKVNEVMLGAMRIGPGPGPDAGLDPGLRHGERRS